MPERLLTSADRFPVQPVRRAYQQVADQLREKILSGSLAVGERLPTEAELCAQFKTSRSTIREALRLLSSQSLIRTQPGAKGGSSVTLPEPEQIADFLRTTLALLAEGSDLTVDELLEARQLLEVPAARMAATKAPQELIEQLESLAPLSLQNLDRQRVFDINWAFHETILIASGNRLLRLMTEPIFTVLQKRFLRDRATPPFWDQVAHEHRLIAEALRKGEPEEAAQAMEDHLCHLAPAYRSMDVRRKEADAE